ncbi:glutathione S-transferase [Sphingobium jiangsuense]|uniref:glutathione transferase n=1 Tax=Sphingobium jiangsuense TaxID=870476 RepID=A0A7W6BNE0_9SPHN|nr:glutathione S-transferase [Sphingobium jiangsuense]MBB3925793.1 glutathione S-transferase [Sphingobium jiangsuense]GLT00959.1 glutathione S-transferase [Sphingobium jiangsuense]
MVTVHHLSVSQSDRIVWLCEELELPYELKIYPRDPDTNLAPADYRALHPFGTAPVITDGDLVLGESGAIIEYLCAKAGGRLAVGPGAPNYPDYLFWLHFANGSLMPALMVDVLASMLGAEAEGGMAAMLRERTDRAYAMLEDRLGKAPYLAGEEFTAADIITLFPLTTMRQFMQRDLAPYPHIRAYLHRIGERPAYRRAMEKADPGMPLNLS